MAATKHEQIIKYIEDLAVGTKVSVRQIAKVLEVSDGTAYRAIKEAEGRGLVSSIPKVGTVRIEKIEEKEIEDLTFAEITKIVEGTVICDAGSLDRTFKSFVIGASSVDVLERLVGKDSLFIVGNREAAQIKALECGANLLIVASFPVTDVVLNLAREKGLTIISTPYDSFAVTTMINWSLHERLKEKEVVLVEDIMIKDYKAVNNTENVGDWHNLAKLYDHSRLPVIDDKNVVVGIVTALDVAGVNVDTPIKDVMNDTPVVFPDASVSHAARIMTWDGVELVPVVDEYQQIIGVISRQDIIDAYQHVQKQPHVVETIDNIVLSGFKTESIENGEVFRGEITEFMTNEFGAASIGTLVTLLNSAAYIAIRKMKKMDLQTESFSLLNYVPVEMSKEIQVKAIVKQIVKRSVKLHCSITHDDQLIAEALVSGRMTE